MKYYVYPYVDGIFRITPDNIIEFHYNGTKTSPFRIYDKRFWITINFGWTIDKIIGNGKEITEGEVFLELL